MKLLFIIGVLDSGGVAKSLVNLLNTIDRKGREIHLLVMSAGEGLFDQYIPEDVIIHRNPIISWLLCGLGGMWQLVKHGYLLRAFGSLIRMILAKVDKPSAGWILGHLFPAIEGEWDIIIDYNGQQDLYYMVDKLKAKKKITFFHSDYKKWPYYEKMDRMYYPKVDAICTISEQCVTSLKEVFPEIADKVRLIPNISLPSMIYKLAEEHVEMPALHGHVLLTLGHVCYNKGVDLAIEAGKILLEKKINFTWLFVGSTSGADNYLKDVSNSDLRNHFVFCGVQANPYVFMKRADIVVHPSRFEGKSIALDEAKIMHKPVVVTGFSTVYDQFENGINASICRMNGADLADAIINLIDNPALTRLYSDNLSANETTSFKELKLVNDLLN